MIELKVTEILTPSGVNSEEKVAALVAAAAELGIKLDLEKAARWTV